MYDTFWNLELTSFLKSVHLIADEIFGNFRAIM